MESEPVEDFWYTRRTLDFEAAFYSAYNNILHNLIEAAVIKR